MIFLFSLFLIKCNKIGEFHTNQGGSFRSSHLQMFLKTSLFENFVIFTGKHLCWSLFTIKLLAFRQATILKRDSNTGVFLWILESFKNNFFVEQLGGYFCSFQETLSGRIFGDKSKLISSTFLSYQRKINERMKRSKAGWSWGFNGNVGKH